MRNILTESNDPREDPLMKRAQVYKLLSLFFSYPSMDLLTHLRAGNCLEALEEAVKHLEKHQSSLASARRFREIMQQEIPRQTLEDIQAEYNRLFIATTLMPCPPYETEYGVSHVFAKTMELADISGFYAAFGLKPSDDRKERPDHISTELEFIHALAVKEGYAGSKEWGEKAEICRLARQKFLKEHLGRWAKSFCRLVENTSDIKFYELLSDFASRFLEDEMEYLQAKPEEEAELQQSPARPDRFTCDAGCGENASTG